MSATIKFNGLFQDYFSNVNPSDIILCGKKLTIKGRTIPVGDKYLISALGVFACAAKRTKGFVNAVIESDGNMQYTMTCSDYKVDYIATRIFNFGTIKDWKKLDEDCVPSEDKYLDGDSYLYSIYY